MNIAEPPEGQGIIWKTADSLTWGSGQSEPVAATVATAPPVYLCGNCRQPVTGIPGTFGRIWCSSCQTFESPTIPEPIAEVIPENISLIGCKFVVPLPDGTPGECGSPPSFVTPRGYRCARHMHLEATTKQRKVPS